MIIDITQIAKRNTLHGSLKYKIEVWRCIKNGESSGYVGSDYAFTLRGAKRIGRRLARRHFEPIHVYGEEL